MKKGRMVLFTICLFAIFFQVNLSHAWTAGKVKIIEEEGLFLVEVKDAEINPEDAIATLKVTKEHRSKVLNFFGVKRPEDIESLDRDEINKTPPLIIRGVDNFINNLKKNIFRSEIA